MAIFIAYLVARICLASMLIASGSAKLADSRSFANTLMSLGLATHRTKLALRFAFILSFLELLVGIGVLSDFSPVALNVILLGITCCFILVVLFALYKAPHTSCRCFGALSNSQFSKRSLVRNIVIMAIALFVLVSSLYFQPLQTQEALWLGLLLIAGYALFAFSVAQAAKIESRLKEETVA